MQFISVKAETKIVDCEVKMAKLDFGGLDIDFDFNI